MESGELEGVARSFERLHTELDLAEVVGAFAVLEAAVRLQSARLQGAFLRAMTLSSELKPERK